MIELGKKTEGARSISEAESNGEVRVTAFYKLPLI
jgi:hypothetical protein